MKYENVACDDELLICTTQTIIVLVRPSEIKKHLSTFQVEENARGIHFNISFVT